MRTVMSLMLVGLMLMLGLEASWPEASQAANSRQPSRVVVRPGGSIQAAVDSVAEGGIVIIEPGTYPGPVQITKVVNLIGSGVDATQIVGGSPREVGSARDATGLITYGAGGGGGIRELALRGGPNGIVARVAAGSLSLKNLLITDTGRGVLWMSPGTLTVRESEVSNVRWHGIAVSDGSVILDVVLIQFILGAGVFINSGPATC